MRPFAYSRPLTIDDALASAAPPGAAFLAGGTELLNWMRLGIAAPDRVIDIGRLAGLEGVTPLGDGGLRIGGLTKLNDAAQHPAVVRDYPVLSQAILKSASAQLRNLATVGGNPLQKTRCAYFRQDDLVPCNKRLPGSGCSALAGFHDKHAIFGWNDTCIATHPADPPVALAALDAQIVLRSARAERRIPVRDFIVAPSAERPDVDNRLAPGELVVAFELPAPALKSAYLKVRERQSYEYATVSCAAALEMNGELIARARIALGSVAHKPWRLDEAERQLVGTRPGSKEARAAAFVDARTLPLNAYKLVLAKNAVARTIEMAQAA